MPPGALQMFVSIMFPIGFEGIGGAKNASRLCVSISVEGIGSAKNASGAVQM